jgi:hypothetical protein
MRRFGATSGLRAAHKLIRKWDATHAAMHDSQKLDDLLDLSNTGNGVWVDSAYRSDQIEASLKAKRLQIRQVMADHDMTREEAIKILTLHGGL